MPVYIVIQIHEACMLVYIVIQIHEACMPVYIVIQIHEACMPVYIVIQIFLAGGHSTRGRTRGPRGPKKHQDLMLYQN